MNPYLSRIDSLVGEFTNNHIPLMSIEMTDGLSYVCMLSARWLQLMIIFIIDQSDDYLKSFFSSILKFPNLLK